MPLIVKLSVKLFISSLLREEASSTAGGLGPGREILRVLFPIPAAWPRGARPASGTGPLLRTLPDSPFPARAGSAAVVPSSERNRQLTLGWNGGLVELAFFGRSDQGEGGCVRIERSSNVVEVAGTDFALVLGCGVAAGLGGEFLFLELDVSGHAFAGVAVGEVEHRVVEGVESGQGDELEGESHGAEFALELGDGGVVQVLAPVERRRAVVGEHLVRELGFDAPGDFPGRLH